MILAILHAELALLAASMILVLIKACYGTNLHKFVSISFLVRAFKGTPSACSNTVPQWTPSSVLRDHPIMSLKKHSAESQSNVYRNPLIFFMRDPLWPLLRSGPLYNVNNFFPSAVIQ